MKHITFFAAAFLAIAPQVSSSQTLVDVAKAEEARRQTVKKSAKVFTNDDLKPDITSPTAATASPASPTEPGEKPEGSTPPATDAAAGAAAPPAPGAMGDQGYWSGRMAAARTSLSRSRMFAEALQTRINALTADAINRDDPAQRSVLEQDRIKAIDELARVNEEIEDQTKAIADIETEARRAGVPPGWLR